MLDDSFYIGINHNHSHLRVNTDGYADGGGDGGGDGYGDGDGESYGAY